MPTAENDAQRGEGVGILLSPVGFNAWHAVGDAWCAVSSRIVSVRLKLASAAQRQAGGCRCSSDIFLTVISVYLPTCRTPRHIEGAFWNDLQVCLAAAPGSDNLLMLGGFNAIVDYYSSPSIIQPLIIRTLSYPNSFKSNITIKRFIATLYFSLVYGNCANS